MIKLGVVVLSLVAACGGDDGGGNVIDASTGVDAYPDAPVGNAMIGPEGGAVASADGVLVLTVPAGAVAMPTEFTVDVVPQAMWPASVAALDPVGAVYEIGPEGTTFAAPATLTWTFAAAPANARDGTKPRMVFGYARSAADAIDPHAMTTSTPTSMGALSVVSEVAHLSQQFLSARIKDDPSPLAPFATIDVELGGGRHAVGVPWDSLKVAAIGGDIYTSVRVRAGLSATAPVSKRTVAGWTAEVELPPFEYGHETYNATFQPNTPWTPGTLPRWECTAMGMGKVALSFRASAMFASNLGVGGRVRFSEDVECYAREQKQEYTDETTALGVPRIAPLAVPAIGTTDLATTSGAYGYLITIPPGGTIRVCVTASMAASVNYYPQYPPGFTFVDGAPGCTDITNLDPDNPNVVLVKVAGGGSPNTITVTTSVP